MTRSTTPTHVIYSDRDGYTLLVVSKFTPARITLAQVHVR